jgi:hypothetical protein
LSNPILFVDSYANDPQEFSLMPRTSKAATKAPRVYTATRLTPQMRQSLIDAAERSGRSITQEIELRLEIATMVMGNPVTAVRGKGAA